MDCFDLSTKIEYLGPCGIVLTSEQKASLNTSLTLLKYEQKFVTVNFWGIIKGVDGDYYIAKGIGRDLLNDARFLYSKDCANWVLMPKVGTDVIEKSRLLRARFTGDPMFKFQHSCLKQELSGNELRESESQIDMYEEDRLSAVVHRIDREAFIVPRGAYHRLATGQVIRNKDYQGLSKADCGKLSSYLHFREPLHYPHRPLEEAVGLDRAIDFLDTIEEDIPKGCWCVIKDRGGTVVYVKSLLWLGYVLYTLPERQEFGSLYVGCGDYNIDLPFMLPTGN